MALVASSLAPVLNLWVKIDDFFTTDSKIVICLACNKSIGCSMKSQLDQHVQSTLHTRNKRLSSLKKQVLLTQMQQSSTSRNEFFKDMCSWMVSAKIPWFKLQMPKFWSYLEKYGKQHIPDQSALRKHLPTCYEETLEDTKGNTGDAFIWVAVDKTDSMGCFITNLVAGKLGIEVPSNPHLICSKVLHHTNYCAIARFVNDGLKMFRVHKKKVLIFIQMLWHIC
jgi:hypothetical protein